MAHIRKRHLVAAIEKTKAFSPLIGILGHRQVGKTTLLEGLAKQYFSLDEPNQAQEATDDPSGYLKARGTGWVALDECQNIPVLFPALKEFVRITKQKPGQFLLSGSVRFTSKKNITESLTGRIVNFELLPLTISELLDEPLSSFFLDTVQFGDLREVVAKHEGKISKKVQTATQLYLENGSLPGVCFIRDRAIRSQRLQTYLETMLDRDLRSVIPTNLPYQTLRELARELAASQVSPLEITSLQKRTGISRPTLKRLIYGLESIFIIRTMKIEGERRGQTLLFEDIGEANWLAGSKGESKYIQFLFNHCRSEFLYRLDVPVEFFQYRTRKGLIHFAARTATGILGVHFISESRPTRSELFAANSFLQSYGNSRVVFVHTESDFDILSPRLLCAPMGSVV